jgi:hypothetical protein
MQNYSSAGQQGPTQSWRGEELPSVSRWHSTELTALLGFFSAGVS